MSDLLDQTTAKRLFEEGAFFIFLDVPPETEFGIDLKSWSTGDKFRGVKMIPPGLHFVFFNATNDTDIAPRIGFFHNFKKGEILAKKWDKLNETISTEPVSEAEIAGLKRNITLLDEFLGPYPYDILEKWLDLSRNISEDLIKQLNPESNQIKSVLELESITDAERPRGTKEQDCSTSKKIKLLPNLRAIKGTEIRFTPLPDKYPAGASPSEITQYCLDSTFSLNCLIKKYDNYIDIIGEIEFCFICFLVGHSLEAFEQWKKLITLFCNSIKAVEQHQRLYGLLVDLLEIQVKDIPEEFLADIVANNNVVYTNLRNLFRNIKSGNVNGQLKTKIERFAKDLSDLYLWDFGHLEEEEEDEAPVIVEL